MSRLEKHDSRRLFDVLYSEKMMDVLSFLLGWGLGAVVIIFSHYAHAADLSSLQRTPVRLVAVERREPEIKPFTPPPCVGIVWPVRMARCELTVRF